MKHYHKIALELFDLTEFIVLVIKGQRHWTYKIEE